MSGGSSSGVRYDFARGIGKITRNTSGDCRRKTMRLAIGNVGGFQIMGVRSLIKLGGHASGLSEDDAVENSFGVRWELAEGIGSLLGWHKRVRWKKIETRRKIVGGSRKA
ncbi:hypothetical protein BHM03_00033359 [Ensete ventricosum]|nr:hypothetical protein BHM03_00033359 [Ensete ventricosum]